MHYGYIKIPPVAMALIWTAVTGLVVAGAAWGYFVMYRGMDAFPYISSVFVVPCVVFMFVVWHWALKGQAARGRVQELDITETGQGMRIRPSGYVAVKMFLFVFVGMWFLSPCMMGIFYQVVFPRGFPENVLKVMSSWGPPGVLMVVAGWAGFWRQWRTRKGKYDIVLNDRLRLLRIPKLGEIHYADLLRIELVEVVWGGQSPKLESQVMLHYRTAGREESVQLYPWHNDHASAAKFAEGLAVRLGIPANVLADGGACRPHAA